MPTDNDPRDLWKNQPTEEYKMNIRLMKRRADELYASTRMDILVSLGAAVFFVLMMTWRFGPLVNPVQHAAVALIATWVLSIAYKFRHDIRYAVPPDSVAAAGVDYYRSQLVKRRDHLRNAWMWHYPFVFATVGFVASFAGEALASPRVLRNMTPFLTLLAAWLVLSVVLRRKRVQSIQTEIDELQPQ
jgi:hypothetical protein